MPAQTPSTLRTTLITGASSGIGVDLAECCAAAGHRIILTARNHDALEQLAARLRSQYHVEAIVIPEDLSKPDAPRRLFDQLSTYPFPIDILINNAGFGALGEFIQLDLQTQLNMLQVNIAALTHLTRLFAPGMVQRRWGRIMQVASTAAFQPGPLMAVYYASKAYVLSLSEALDAELRQSNVTVTALCPGPTRTAFQQRAGSASKLFNAGFMMESKPVAEMGYRAMMASRRLAIPGWRNRLMAFSVRFAPRGLVLTTAKKLNAPTGPAPAHGQPAKSPP